MSSKLARRASTLIFLHIPKAGGQTLYPVIRRQYPAGAVYRLQVEHGPEMEKFLDLPEADRRRIRALKGHLSFGIHKLLPQSCTYMTFLRHPVDRTVSTYYYIARNPKHTHHAALAGGKLSLEEFVERGISVNGTDNGQTRNLCGLPRAAAEVPLGSCTRQMLDSARANLRRCFSGIGFVEDFDRSLVLLRRTYGWKTPTYRKVNVGHNRLEVAQLPPRVVDLIAARNTLDLELYRYARGLYEERLRRHGPLLALEVAAFRLVNRVHGMRGRTGRR